MKKIIKSSLLILLLFLVSCKDKPLENKQINETKIGKEIEKMLVQKPVSTTSLKIDSMDFSALKDPFKTLKKVDNKIKEKSKLTEPAIPLFAYNVNEFKIIGIILSSDSHHRVMVVTPNGKGYTVKIGSKIGNNHGVLTEISKNSIVITEMVENENGKKQKEKIVLTLPVK